MVSVASRCSTDTRREISLISENSFVYSAFETSVGKQSSPYCQSVSATPTDPLVLTETISDLVVGYGISAESN